MKWLEFAASRIAFHEGQGIFPGVAKIHPSRCASFNAKLKR
jgi:hypothetical protein